MQLNYEQAKHFEGKLVHYQNTDGEWTVGKVVKVKRNGFEIEELKTPGSGEGYGFGFWGPGPFFGPPAFVPFFAVGFAAPFFW